MEDKKKTKRSRQKKQPWHEWATVVDLNAIIRESSEMLMWMSERPNKDEVSCRLRSQTAKICSAFEHFQRHAKKLVADCEMEGK